MFSQRQLQRQLQNHIPYRSQLPGLLNAATNNININSLRAFRIATATVLLSATYVTSTMSVACDGNNNNTTNNNNKQTQNENQKEFNGLSFSRTFTTKLKNDPEYNFYSFVRPDGCSSSPPDENNKYPMLGKKKITNHDRHCFAVSFALSFALSITLLFYKSQFNVLFYIVWFLSFFLSLFVIKL